MDVFSIPAIAIIGGLSYAAYELHMKHKYKLSLLANKHTPEQVADMARDIAELKQRVATLEAIVTDKSYDLKQQINRL